MQQKSFPDSPGADSWYTAAVFRDYSRHFLMGSFLDLSVDAFWQIYIFRFVVLLAAIFPFLCGWFFGDKSGDDPL